MKLSFTPFVERPFKKYLQYFRKVKYLAIVSKNRPKFGLQKRKLHAFGSHPRTVQSQRAHMFVKLSTRCAISSPLRSWSARVENA